jgi:DNA replication protein
LRNDPFPLPEELAKFMAVDVLTIKSNIASLIEKRLLNVERKFNNSSGEWINFFSLDLLFDKLAEIWAFEKAKQREENSSKKNINTSSEILGQLYQAFEKEFGRLLSPMESSQLIEWCEGDGYSPDLIFEALKRAVLRGILNFKYIDSILRDWARNQITTVKQAIAYEERFQKTKFAEPANKTKQESGVKAKAQKDKYKDFYLS